MKNSRKNSRFIGASIIAAILASLCCIAPFVAIVAGISGLATTFSWLEPIRPHLMVISGLILGYAFYLAYKPKKEINCDCENKKEQFMNSKIILWSVTIVSILLFAFPYYSSKFFPNLNKPVTSQKINFRTASIKLDGMTCEGCENIVNYSLISQKGVVNASSSYKTGIVKVQFDSSKTSLNRIKNRIEETTNYKVKKLLTRSTQ